MRITLTGRGFVGAIEALTGIDELVDRETPRLVRDATQNAHDEIVKAAPRGGRVTRGVKMKVDGTDASTTGRVQLQGAARLVATGARPHQIRPVRTRAMRLPDGTFLRRVRHPGFGSRPFLLTGVEASIPATEQSLQRAGDAIVTEVAAKIEQDRR